MRVLLTGHKGHIGTVLTPMLLEPGHDAHDHPKGTNDNCGRIHRIRREKLGLTWANLSRLWRRKAEDTDVNR